MPSSSPLSFGRLFPSHHHLLFNTWDEPPFLHRKTAIFIQYIPTFKLRIDDFSHPDAKLFFNSINTTQASRWGRRHLAIALRDTGKGFKKVRALAPAHRLTRSSRAVESVLPCRARWTAAHTAGSDTEKEIRFASQHIVNTAARAADEIRGVVTHEVVHCYQYNANGTAPGGLIEGVASA